MMGVTSGEVLNSVVMLAFGSVGDVVDAICIGSDAACACCGIADVAWICGGGNLVKKRRRRGGRLSASRTLFSIFAAIVVDDRATMELEEAGIERFHCLD